MPAYDLDGEPRPCRSGEHHSGPVREEHGLVKLRPVFVLDAVAVDAEEAGLTPALTMRANRAAPIISWRAPLCKRGSGPEFMRCAQQGPASLGAKCYRASLGLGRHGSSLVRLCVVRSHSRNCGGQATQAAQMKPRGLVLFDA